MLWFHLAYLFLSKMGKGYVSFTSLLADAGRGVYEILIFLTLSLVVSEERMTLLSLDHLVKLTCITHACGWHNLHFPLSPLGWELVLPNWPSLSSPVLASEDLSESWSQPPTTPWAGLLLHRIICRVSCLLREAPKWTCLQVHFAGFLYEALGVTQSLSTFQGCPVILQNELLWVPNINGGKILSSTFMIYLACPLP